MREPSSVHYYTYALAAERRRSTRALRLLELQLRSLYYPTLLDSAKEAAEAEATSYLHDPYTAQNLAVRTPSSYHDDTLASLGLGKRLYYGWNNHLPCLLGAHQRVLPQIWYRRRNHEFHANVFRAVIHRFKLPDHQQHTSDLATTIIEIKKHAQCHT